MFTDVSEKHAALIFRIGDDPGDGGSTFFRIDQTTWRHIPEDSNFRASGGIQFDPPVSEAGMMVRCKMHLASDKKAWSKSTWVPGYRFHVVEAIYGLYDGWVRLLSNV
jgi:hypothetical protein